MMNFEHTADPELEPQRTEDQRVRAFGQNGRTIAGDAMDLHLERAGAQRSEEFHGPVATMDRREPNVLVHQVVGQGSACGFEVGVLQRIEETLDYAGVLNSLL